MNKLKKSLRITNILLWDSRWLLLILLIIVFVYYALFIQFFIDYDPYYDSIERYSQYIYSWLTFLIFISILFAMIITSVVYHVIAQTEIEYRAIASEVGMFEFNIWLALINFIYTITFFGTLFCIGIICINFSDYFKFDGALSIFGIIKTLLYVSLILLASISFSHLLANLNIRYWKRVTYLLSICIFGYLLTGWSIYPIGFIEEVYWSINNNHPLFGGEDGIWVIVLPVTFIWLFIINPISYSMSLVAFCFTPIMRDLALDSEYIVQYAPNIWWYLQYVINILELIGVIALSLWVTKIKYKSRTNEPMEEAIKIKGLYKSFEGMIINNNINMNIQKNEVVAIIGENGSGKSVLAKQMIGVYKSDSGNINIDGLMNVHMQNKFYESDLSASDYIQVSLLLLDVERNERIVNMIEFFEIDKFTSVSTRNLSGGQRQRLSLFLSLANEPDILILDEFISGIDMIGVELILEKLFTKLNGKTIVIIEHDADIIRSVADKIIVLKNNTIKFEINMKDIPENEESLTKFLINKIR